MKFRVNQVLAYIKNNLNLPHWKSQKKKRERIRIWTIRMKMKLCEKERMNLLINI